MSILPNSPPHAYAKMAGLMYLLIAVFGGFSIGYVPTVIVVAGDATATAQNLLAHQTLFRLGIAGDVFVLLVEIILTVMLYRLLKPVDSTLSMVAAFARLGMVMVMAVNLIIYVLPLLLLSGVPYLAVFDAPQIRAAVLVLFEAHQLGIYVWQLLFGLHLLFVGVLVCRSGYFPRVLGGMMFVGAFGYLLEGITHLMAFSNGSVSLLIIGLLIIVTVAELSFAIWLLVKGVRGAQWAVRAGAV